jgi:RNA polymerase sigma-70 factor (ECF subfamily)
MVCATLPVCFPIAGRQSGAEDLVQEVFIKIWNQKEELNPDTEKAYLYQAVYRSGLNLLKKEKRHSHVSETEAYELAAGHLAEDGILLRETEEKLEKGLQSLPEACREIFMLSRFEEMSYKEIAQVLEISIKTVEAQMGKALKILRQHFLSILFIFFILINRYL